jgi:sigma-B regulation protein RsbU (phosphoserine phosphatase)
MSTSASPTSSTAGADGLAAPLTVRSTDLSGRPNIRVLAEMMQAVSRAREPAEVQRSFGRGMRRLKGVDGYISTSVRGMEPGAYKITRKLLDGVDAEGEVPNPWRDWDALPESRGGILGSIQARGEPALLQRMRVEGDSALGDEIASFGSMIAVPLWDGGTILNWAFFLAKNPEAFSAEVVEELLVTSNLIGGTVRNVLANRRLEEADAAKTREIERIAAIQRSILPNPLPTLPGAELGAAYATFDAAGGDLYAVRNVRIRGESEPAWLLLIADASGHGTSAAVVSAMVDAVVDTIPDPIEGPSAILETLNDYLFRKRVESGFVTAFVGIFRPQRRTVRWSRAGHNPPLLRGSSAGISVRLLDDVGDIPLGIAPQIRFEEATTTLAPGDTLVLYTDGIVEARGPSGEMFGVERIEDALRTCSGAPQCAVDSITKALLAFEAGVRPGDDQTLLVMQVKA